jgi:Zinc finger, C3HC4 type (RING finger)
MEFYNIVPRERILDAKWYSNQANTGISQKRSYGNVTKLFLQRSYTPCFDRTTLECAICSEIYANEVDQTRELCVLPCYHVYHKDCYDSYINSQFVAYLKTEVHNAFLEHRIPSQPWQLQCPFRCDGPSVLGKEQKCLQAYLGDSVRVLPRLFFTQYELYKMTLQVNGVPRRNQHNYRFYENGEPPGYLNATLTFLYYDYCTKKFSEGFLFSDFKKAIRDFYVKYPFDSVYKQQLETMIRLMDLSYYGFPSQITRGGKRITKRNTRRSDHKRSTKRSDHKRSDHKRSTKRKNHKRLQ